MKYTGHERDLNRPGQADDLDYMHARYCSPLLGRFLSPDPINSATAATPQGWNKYAYVSNNPLIFNDPDGARQNPVTGQQGIDAGPERGTFGRIRATTANPNMGRWGHTRRNPDLSPRFHPGIDINAPTGTPVFAAEGGTITDIGDRGVAGKRLQLTMLNGTVLTYAHLEGFTPGLSRDRSLQLHASRRLTMRRVSLAIGFLVATWSSTAFAVSDVLGIRPGEASISDVLIKLGPAEGAYLAGSDADAGPHEGDPVVLRFVGEYRLVEPHSSEILAFFEPETYRLTGFVVRFEQSVPAKELQRRFGDRFQVIRQHLVLDPGGIEGSLEPCNDPSGPYVSWIFEDLGLQAGLDESGAVAALQFKAPITVQEEFPPCVSQPVETP